MGIDVRKRFSVMAGVLLVGLLFLLPTFFPAQMPTNWVSKPLSLGLDLSGGIHLVYQVRTDEALKSRLQQIGNGIRNDLKKNANIAVLRVRAPDEKTLELTFLSESSADRAKTKIEDGNKDLIFKVKRQDEDRYVLVFSVAENYALNVKKNSVKQSIETLRSRVDQFGVTEPLIQQIGEERILLQMPGVSDVAAVKRVVGSVAKLEFRLLHQSGSSAGKMMLKGSEGESVAVQDEVLMTGDAVEDARVAFDAAKGPEVSLELNNEGAKTFAKITGEHVGEQLAIILDGVVKSSPRINERIGGGRASISGHFTTEDARELAVVLRAGALPAPLDVLEERTVGPTLGRESIKAGVLSIIASLSFIGIFMVFYYKKSGIIAISSLVLNVFLVMACLSAFGATLTLPGLAGLALTVGMAVDSNVLIFERIREELRIGASRDVAVAAGFERALNAIIDSNITAILSCFVLYFFGTGAIRGFAVVTSVGIVATLFCAVFVARTFFELFELKGKNQIISV